MNDEEIHGAIRVLQFGAEVMEVGDYCGYPDYYAGAGGHKADGGDWVH
jgi:hypothetical protein